MSVRNAAHQAARHTVTGAVLVALGLLGGCSGDDEPEDDTSPSARASDQGQAQAKSRSCKVEVELTGVAQGTWEGKGRAITGNASGPEAIYQFDHEDGTLSAYSEGEGFVPSAVVSVDGATYTTQPESAGLEISPKGRTATVDADAIGTDSEAEGVHIAASFDC